MARLFTAKERRTYQNICHLTERGVLSMMADFLRSKYQNIIVTPNFVIALGDIKVALVAHADTVFAKPPSINNFFYDVEKNVIWNPDGMGADDRAGIYSILHILRNTELRPHVIITTGEEMGCIGSGKLISTYRKFPDELNFMIQLDRRGMKDSVFYDCDVPEFEDYVNAFGFETNWGTFTDISVLAPAWGCAAVNFSIGYVDEHNEIERLFVDGMFDTIQKVINILTDQIKHPQYFKYEESFYSYYWKDDGTLETYANHCAKAYGYGKQTGWNYDDNWALPEGFGNCTFCHTQDSLENMIPLYFGPNGKVQYEVCLDCFSKHSNCIVFCNKCGKGYYMGTNQLKTLGVKSADELKTYICEECRNELDKESSAPSGQGIEVQSESSDGSDRQTSISLVKSKNTIY